MPNRSTPDYWFEKAEQCFRRSRIDSNGRVKLDALGNVFMVKAVELDTKLLFILRLLRIDRDSEAPQRRVSRQSDLPADLMAFSLRSNYIKSSHPR
jgi:hypothetical protein